MKKNSLSTLFFTAFMDLMGMSFIIPIMAPLFLSRQGIFDESATQAIRMMSLGLLIASYPFFQFFGAPLLGSLSDRYGRKKILLISLCGTGLGYLLSAIAVQERNLAGLFAGRILSGMSAGNIAVIYSSIADITPERDKAKNFGLIGMAFGMGFIFGPWIGGKLADPGTVPWFNFATPYWGAATFTVLNLIFVISNFQETLQQRRDVSLRLNAGIYFVKKAFSRKRVRVIFSVVFLTTLGFNFFTQFFQVYLVQKFQFHQAQIGTFFAYIGFWIMFTQGVLMRFYFRRFSPTQVLPISILLLSLMFPLILFPTHAKSLYWLNPFIAIFQGLTHPNLMALISNLSGKEEQGEILGINQSVQSLAMVFPPLIAGMIVSIHRSFPILAAGLFVFLGWAVYIVFFGRLNKERSLSS